MVRSAGATSRRCPSPRRTHRSRRTGLAPGLGNARAGSTGHRNEFGGLLRWFHESKRLAWTIVEAASESGGVLCAVDWEIGSLRHVLAEEPVGIFVRPPLPGTMGIAEVHLNASCHCEVRMMREFSSLIPGDETDELRRERCDRLAHGFVDHVWLSTVGQVQEEHEAGAPLDQCPHAKAPVLADDEISLPAARHRSIPRLGRAIRDHRHAIDPATASSASAWPAPRPHVADPRPPVAPDGEVELELDDSEAEVLIVMSGATITQLTDALREPRCWPGSRA